MRVLATLLICLITGAASAQTLTIATTGTFPPYLFEEGERPTGFDIDLMDEICRINRFECDYVIYPLREGLEAVQRGQADIALGGIGITEDREVYGDFTCAYRRSDFTSAPIFALDPNIDLSTARIAVMADTQLQVGLEAQGFTAVPYEDLEGAIRSVLSGETDAYHGNGNSLPLVDGAQEQLIVVGEVEGDGGGVGFLVAADQPRLLAIVNDSLGLLARDGALQEMADDWFGVGEFQPPEDMSINCGAMLTSL